MGDELAKDFLADGLRLVTAGDDRAQLEFVAEWVGRLVREMCELQERVERLEQK
jgi:hypothetical protein